MNIQSLTPNVPTGAQCLIGTVLVIPTAGVGATDGLLLAASGWAASQLGCNAGGSL